MTKGKIFFTTLLLLVNYFIIIEGEKCLDTDRNVNDLFLSMNIKEKCGQMTQITLDVLANAVSDLKEIKETPPLDVKKVKMWLEEFHVGSILNSAAFGSIFMRYYR